MNESTLREERWNFENSGEIMFGIKGERVLHCFQGANLNDANVKSNIIFYCDRFKTQVMGFWDLFANFERLQSGI